MRMSTFALVAVSLSLLAILAVAHFMPALRQDPSPGVSVSPTLSPEPAAMPLPDVAPLPDLNMPEMSLPMFDFPRLFDSRASIAIPTIKPTPTPTAVRPCPTPMQPMQPMEPWKPMAAMTPMLT